MKNEANVASWKILCEHERMSHLNRNTDEGVIPKMVGNGFIVQVYRLCLGKLTETLIMVYFLFENSLDIFLLVFYKHSMYGKGT